MTNRKENQYILRRGVQELVYMQLYESVGPPTEIIALNCKKRENDWIVVLKATVAGKPMVAFFNHDTLGDAILGMCAMLTYGRVQWRPDKWVKG